MADTYTVTNQTEVFDVGATGTPERMVEITFKTIPHEVEGTVRVPYKDFNAASAERALEKAALEREAVASL